METPVAVAAPLLETSTAAAPAAAATDARRRRARVVLLFTLVSTVLAAVALAVPWWTLRVQPGSPFESSAVGSVWRTNVCDAGSSCRSISAYDDDEPVLRSGQLTAGALLLTSIVSSATSTAIVCCRMRPGGVPSAGLAAAARARWLAVRIAMRASWAAAASATAAGYFAAQARAWEDAYVVAKAPPGTPITWAWGPGLGCAAAAAALSGALALGAGASVVRRGGGGGA